MHTQIWICKRRSPSYFTSGPLSKAMDWTLHWRNHSPLLPFYTFMWPPPPTPPSKDPFITMTNIVLTGKIKRKWKRDKVGQWPTVTLLDQFKSLNCSLKCPSLVKYSPLVHLNDSVFKENLIVAALREKPSMHCRCRYSCAASVDNSLYDCDCIHKEWHNFMSEKEQWAKPRKWIIRQSNTKKVCIYS